MSDRSSADIDGTFGLDGPPATAREQWGPGVRHDHTAGERSNDHLASIYEGRGDQFAAVVPYIREGLERGERCLYIADDATPEAVIDALAAGGVDVDAARESGALSVHTKADTYLRTGEFDREAMFDFLRETLEEARADGGYAGVRAAAEMTWALEEDTAFDRLLEYEALLNDVYDGEDFVGLCQYDRERFPTAVLSEVIRTHPLVVYDGTVCPNVHYHPPEEFLAADRPPLDVDRTVDGLVERARARQALDERDRRHRSRLRQQEVVAELSRQCMEAHDLDDFLAEVAERVADTFDADRCGLLDHRPESGDMLLREGVGWRDGAVGEPTVDADRDSPAAHALRAGSPVVVADLATDTRFDGSALPVDREATSGICAVVGPPDDPWGVLAAYVRDRRDRTEHDATFVRSVANTVATAVERTERERYERELHDVASAADLTFEGKLQAVFDLGCERFDLELGGLARIDPEADRFEVEHVSGDHEHLEPGTRLDLSETYCRVHDEAGSTTGVTDPEAEGLEDTTAHEEFGVRSYLGTRIAIDDGPDRSLFFVSSEPRRRAFSEAERTFGHLLGQCVSHELERRRDERKLEASIERLERFVYAASHDLQEPLRMVSSYLQLLERRYGDDLDGDAREFIDFAVDGADRMNEMIRALLAYSRVETGGGPFEAVDLGAVVDDVLADLRSDIEASDADITVGPLPRVEGDPGQLRQLFRNLLDNAIEYSGDDPPRVSVSAERRRSRWRVAVSDEGIGIAPGERERVLEVFQRLHTREEHPGTGIGLALCQRIVERHGGDIRVESDPGEGTTFSFTLPAADGRDD